MKTDINRSIEEQALNCLAMRKDSSWNRNQAQTGAAAQYVLDMCAAMVQHQHYET